MNNLKLHPSQISIFHTLRYSESERYSTILKPTSQTSDTFKFHLRKLIKQGYVVKLENGRYALTCSGKEHANLLDERNRLIQKQPKISILIIAENKKENGESFYLLQQRLRNPYYGYWAEIHGRAIWGESFEITALHQFTRQTGLNADFAVHNIYRVRDYEEENNNLLEDKIFVVVRAFNITGNLRNSYTGGINKWLSLSEIMSLPKVFKSTILNISKKADNSNKIYDFMYKKDDY